MRLAYAGEVHCKKSLLQADEHGDGQHEDLATFAQQIDGHREQLQAGHAVASIAALDAIAGEID